MTEHVRLDYVWLDGYQPTPSIRTKAQVVDADSFSGDLADAPEWGFDGSSTRQADGSDSDCVLQPVRIYNNPLHAGGYLVLCEVLNADKTTHASNTRSLIDDDTDEFWFGFEQEYVFMTTDGRPLGFPTGGYPEPQGPYYCAVGTHNVAGREIVEEHWEVCLAAGVGVVGINSEVMLGQWEFQCFGKGAKRACDDHIMARYLLELIAEKYSVVVNLDPRPLVGDWNGSGMHSNFSFDYLRDVGGEDYVRALCQGFAPFHQEHLEVYGAGNERRLTGEHETASMDKFSFGPSDRRASIRIPIYTLHHDWKGYLEDRRPASDGDPYRIADRIIKTVRIAHPQAVEAAG